MKISYRSYPYPVLSYFSDDYISCAYQANLKVSSTKTTYKLSIKNFLSDNKLKELVADDFVFYGLHVECKSTRYRRLFTSKKANWETSIPVESVNGTVEVCCILVATKTISQYKNPNFHDDFEEHSFDIQKGDVLAVAQDREFEADSYLDKLKKVPSIFSISANNIETPPPIDTEYGNSKISILLPKESFEKYRYLKADQNHQQILASMIIVPVLVQVISELQADIQGFRENYSDARWFKSIQKRLNEIGYPIIGDKFITDSAVSISYLLIDDPLSGGISNLDGIMEEQ